jgi:sterol desaturase/sphingolipid hydroxylase (fatty acid hydroxylase superfamily)
MISSYLLSLIFPGLPISVLATLALNYGLYYFFFKSSTGQRIFSGRRHYRYQHSRTEILREIRSAIVPECMLAFITNLALSSGTPSPIQHWFSMRWELSWSEVPRIILECVAIFVAYEIYYFIVHRAMHHPRLFRWFHSTHHRSIYPTPQTGTSVDILEAVTFYTFFVVMIFCPLHIASVVLISLNIKIASLTQHLGHEFFPAWIRRSRWLKYLNSTRYHQLHHSGSFLKNYGFQTSFLDRWFNTIDPNYIRYENES